MSGCCKQSNSGRNRLPVLIIPISILFLAVLAVFLFSPGKTAPPVVLTPENFISEESSPPSTEESGETSSEPSVENPESSEPAEPSSEELPSTEDTSDGPDYLESHTGWTSFDGHTFGSVSETYGTIYSLDDLKALDSTKQGFGPGLKTDEANRPLGALNPQTAYDKYGALFIGEDTKNIYLTLDEGYENGYTGKILDVLKENDCKAVFFVTYAYVKQNKELVQRMIDEGHVIGNHSVNHKSMPTLSLEEASREITKLHNYMLEHFQYEMYLFRPPMGEFSEQTLALCQSLGYRSVLWSFAYYDYDTAKQPEPEKALKKITQAAHGGAIYLLHAVSSTNTEILADVIQAFRENGYEVGAIPR